MLRSSRPAFRQGSQQDQDRKDPLVREAVKDRRTNATRKSSKEGGRKPLRSRDTDHTVSNDEMARKCRASIVLMTTSHRVFPTTSSFCHRADWFRHEPACVGRAAGCNLLNFWLV